MVPFPASGATESGYLALPPTGCGPGVIVIQECWVRMLKFFNQRLREGSA